ncbi:MAG TPA: hypothetical protein ENK31_06715, partial [Nannocystis exedens]|nr:hypothetical protein [Nannocystis exedens]
MISICETQSEVKSTLRGPKMSLAALPRRALWAPAAVAHEASSVGPCPPRTTMTDAIRIPDRINMTEWFLDARLAEGRGDRVAIYYRDQQISYREVIKASCQVTNLLRELGLRIEDRVLLLLLDTPEFAYAYFGVLRAGAVAVPANTWLKTDDYAYYLEYVRPRAVIVDAEIYDTLAPALAGATYPPIVIVVDRRAEHQEGSPAGTLDWSSEVGRQETSAETEATYRDDFSTWLSSSGSTGKPKCVVHMHHDFIWSTVAYAQRTLGLCAEDITL